MRSEDYLSPDRRAPDRAYAWQAAVLEGYEFDRSRFRVPGSTFRTTDMSHWLALDVTNDALEDAGFPGGEGLPKEATAVVLGNTLTGDLSRAMGLRLRWPYARRVVRAELEAAGMAATQVEELLASMERSFKAPFPPAGEDSLPGGLANTIAGRICNFFDLQGGGYIVDGACASSLLAVATGCGQLAAGDVDVALAGGVDLSIDPFEVVGFAKAGALAGKDMRVYDRRSGGFWPGEGCGMVVLMRAEDAAAQHKDVYAVIRGWGISSDGAGGMTRPDVSGQKLALRRAHQRAEVSIDAVAYIEGHGTGTAVGDAVELQALAEFRREAGATLPAVVGSIKANIGHTKAAAGAAGLIKAMMAVRTGIVPPNTGCERPHPLLEDPDGLLTVLREARPWPSGRVPAAAVSGMGFGGINSHLIIEQAATTRPSGVLAARTRALLATAQDAEVFLLSAPSRSDLVALARRVGETAVGASTGDLRDLAAALGAQCSTAAWRLGVVASTPSELTETLDEACRLLEDPSEDPSEDRGAPRLNTDRGLFLGHGEDRCRIGFLFPGQGAPASLDGGAWRRRFAALTPIYQQANLPVGADVVATQIAQPAIATASVAGLAVLDALGLDASLAVGHSLGELCAYHWAGALGPDALVSLAKARGAAMAAGSEPRAGAMASVFADFVTTLQLVNGTGAVVAAVNSSEQAVVSGASDAVGSVLSRASKARIRAVRLPVSHAFHSPLMAGAVPRLGAALDRLRFAPLARKVVSTVTGEALAPDTDLRELLSRQLTSTVRFADAAALAAKDVDVFFEVGPGHALSGLVRGLAPAIPLDVGGQSLRGLLCAVAAAHALGFPVRAATLFADRITRRFDLDRPRRFLSSPCELAPSDTVDTVRDQVAPEATLHDARRAALAAGGDLAPERITELVRALVAQQAELDESAVGDDDRLLDDLHMSSITVGQIVQKAMQDLGLPAAVAPTTFAGATVGELARALQELATTEGVGVSPARELDGVGHWVRPFIFRLEERPLRDADDPSSVPGAGEWVVLAVPGHRIADYLRTRLQLGPGTRGVAVCLSPRHDDADLGLLVAGAKRALASEDATHFLVVQHGGGGSAFARTLFLEAPHLVTCVIDVGLDDPTDAADAADAIVAEVAAAGGFVEAHYDARRCRRVPTLRLLAPGATSPTGSLPGLGSGDVLLVTGGGKGIAAECALALGRAAGVRLALVGRSKIGNDPELDANLERLRAAGVTVSYASADVTDPRQVSEAIAGLEQALGPITALLHGAGINVPCLISDLDEERMRATVRPKVHGLRHVLAALDTSRLRLLVAFGSLIARTGMRGECDYGVANEWMAIEVERFAGAHPGCRCLTLEWSAWSGAGMVERLGRVEALTREGIDCMPVDLAVDAMMQVLARDDVDGAVALTGRFGQNPTVAFPRVDLPLLRFLEQPQVYYPGIELIADARVRADSDLYMPDHVVNGNAVFPAVLALEAMAQAATAVRADGLPTRFEQVEFVHPVVMPEEGAFALRVASLVTNGRVDMALRSSTTNFLTDHMHATCVFAQPEQTKQAVGSPGPVMGMQRAVGAAEEVNVQDDLYDQLLFQSGRFQRIRKYRSLAATSCIVEVECKQQKWFSAFLPGELLLGDPGIRDAALHCVQAGAPNLPLLPVGVARIERFKPPSGDLVLVVCEERARSETELVADIEICTPDGELCERWSHVRYRLAAKPRQAEQIPASLLAVSLERRLQDLLSRLDLRVALESGVGERRSRSNRALARLLGEDATVTRRVDGRPEVAGAGVSTAHAGDLTLAVVSGGITACDLELVDRCTEAEWQAVLGPTRWELAEAVARAIDDASRRDAGALVWTVGECIVKAGLPATAAVAIRSTHRDGWVVFAAAQHMIASALLRGSAVRSDLAVSVLVSS
jgi:enediyne polyketide synthase